MADLFPSLLQLAGTYNMHLPPGGDTTFPVFSKNGTITFEIITSSMVKLERRTDGSEASSAF